MKKIVFIIPYFGKFNNYFQLFLNTCELNHDVDWLIFTDDKTNYNYPSNVHVKYTSFDEIKNKIQEKFDFEISLTRAYKLCDYKPAYGYVFQDYIKDYDFWGYCDTDLIWGNIRKFYTEEKLKKYDKIGFLGHCTIFRNKKEINEMFMKEINGIKIYQKVFQSEENSSSINCTFDEERNQSINTIFENNNIPCDFTENEANIYMKSSNFRLTKYNFSTNRYEIEKNKKAFFVYDNGDLIRYINNKKIEKEEYMYIHMQSRKMQVSINQNSNYHFKIIPNSFDEIEVNKIDDSTIKKIKTKHFNLHYFKLRSKNLYLKIKKRVKKIWE